MFVITFPASRIIEDGVMMLTNSIVLSLAANRELNLKRQG
jgi:hypothetical protein